MLDETTRSSTQLVDGRLLKVYSDEVTLPDGSGSVREWIDHPGAAAVLPIDPDGNAVLVRQFRYGPRRAFLEIPAGKFDRPGERPDDVARRELREETGWEAGRLESLGALYPCVGYSNEVIHLFLATELAWQGQELADGEFLQVETMPVGEAIREAAEGRFPDMKTTAALLLARDRIERLESG